VDTSRAVCVEHTALIPPASAARNLLPCRFMAPMSPFRCPGRRSNGWLYEVKWSAIAPFCYIDHGKLRMFTRNANSTDRQYPQLAVLSECVQAEMTAVARRRDRCARIRNGLPQLRHAQRRNRSIVFFCVRICFILNGYDLRRCEN